MKKILIGLFAIYSATSFAQERHRIDFETLGGYEYNYFKSPNSIRVNDTILGKEDLISSSLFQDILIDYDYRYRWKGNRLRFSLTPFLRIFQENSDDSYWSLKSSIKYDKELNKVLTFLVEGNFKRMNRNGLDGAQDILVNPLGYTGYGLSSGIQLEPSSKNKTRIEGFYNVKNFDEFGTRDLQFNEFGLQVGTKQEFRPGRYKHSIGLLSYFKKRKYETYNEAEAEDNGQRNWDYFKITAFYNLPLSATIGLKPEFAYYSRIDKLENQSGFNQYGPSLSFKFDNDKTKIRGAFKYSIRNYNTIKARNDFGGINEKLKYGYTNFSLNFEHQLGLKGVSFMGTVYSRIRETNYTDINARSFRGYTNQYAGIGFKYEF